jgi:hypothetical protein
MLIGKYNRRPTSAVAKESSHLILIRKKYYHLLLKAQLKSEHIAQFNFLY